MKHIPFNENGLISGLSEALAHAKGKITLKTASLPPKPAPVSAAKISSIRRKLHVSTPVFAAFLNVDPDTVSSWEKGRRTPSGPALRLLHIARKQPKALECA